ncbi:putative Dual specificity protein kinase YAK1 [Blattamonas nauphoetae]|uniref:Dual specificity protein kinase YAK1 n=1 Tax=Blattamonas nauphoetae TaxID=2049346 RepID=A0ABQ9Y2T5_9EUKA|nr:putative Dual specificity protein kinase YAK1 [Blattamonas nauphoetae]
MASKLLTNNNMQGSQFHQPVHPCTQLLPNRNYSIGDVIAFGGYAQVRRATNELNQTFAVKIIPETSIPLELAIQEALRMSRLIPVDHHHRLALPIDWFTQRINDVECTCIVMPAYGCNLLDYLMHKHPQLIQGQHPSRITMTPAVGSTKILKTILFDIVEGLRVIHSSTGHLIHADIKPENILIDQSTTNFASDEVHVVIADFGNAWDDPFAIQNMNERKGVTGWKPPTPPPLNQTRFYRAPESILGCIPSGAIDIWSLGCLAFELFHGLPLFNPHGYSEGSCEWRDELDDFEVELGTDRDQEHLRLIHAVLHSHPPSDLVKSSFWAEDFVNSETGMIKFKQARHERRLADLLIGWTMTEKSSRIQFLHNQTGSQVDDLALYGQDVLTLESFILDCLTWSPADRPTATELQQHQFFLS